MSVVAVKIDKETISIGADSIVVCGYTQSKDPKAKIFKISDTFAIGGVGFLRDCSLLFIFSKTHTPSSATVEGVIEFFDEFYDWMKKKTDKQPLDNSFIIVFGGKAFLFEDFCIMEITEYAAIGAGRDYATTALHLGHSVNDAIKISCELSIYCEEPITIYTFKKGN